jgi:hypothetical protein
MVRAVVAPGARHQGRPGSDPVVAVGRRGRRGLAAGSVAASADPQLASAAFQGATWGGAAALVLAAPGT